MPRLRFRLPGRDQVLGTWLSLILPTLDRATRRQLIDAGRVRVDGQLADRPGFACPAGAAVEIELDPATFALAFDAESDGDPARDTQRASMPAGRGAARWAALCDAPDWFGGRLQVSETLELQVTIEAAQDGLVRLRLDSAEPLAGPSEAHAAAIRRALASEGAPVVGDLEHGGLAVPGGVRLIALPGAGAEAEAEAGDDATRAASDPGLQGTQRGRSNPIRNATTDGEPRWAWPEEPAWPGPGALSSAASVPRLEVSSEAAHALRKGHPWLLPDAASERAARFQPGRLVQIVERGGEDLAWAHVEGDARLAARVWGPGDRALREVESVEARVARALARRRALLFASDGAPRTEAFRLIHGEGDALPGLFVDRFGPLWRVLVTGRASDGFRERVIAALQMQWPVTPEGEAWSVLEVVHPRSAGARRSGSRLQRVRWLAGGPEQIAAAGYPVDAAGFRVLERGLSFRVEPGWDTPARTRPGVGLFVDQRDNRERLAVPAAAGGRWLNLFAHTGAFSVALLAAGAERVVSVDLSGAYLEQLESNLLANAAQGIELARHESVRGDGRRYLETREKTERFAGIVLDPPTAAAAGRRFWSVRQDLEPMLDRCIRLLEPGGRLLVTQNRAGPPLGLDRILERLARRAQRVVGSVVPAPAGLDHPARPGFPEGDPFEGWLLTLD